MAILGKQFNKVTEYLTNAEKPPIHLQQIQNLVKSYQIRLMLQHFRGLLTQSFLQKHSETNLNQFHSF